MAKEVQDIAIPKLTKLCNTCLKEGKILEKWNNAIMIVLHTGCPEIVGQRF